MRIDRQIVLVTGVGFATARKMAELGASVIMVSRHHNRGAAARRKVVDRLKMVD